MTSNKARERLSADKVKYAEMLQRFTLKYKIEEYLKLSNESDSKLNKQQELLNNYITNEELKESINEITEFILNTFIDTKTPLQKFKAYLGSYDINVFLKEGIRNSYVTQSIDKCYLDSIILTGYNKELFTNKNEKRSKSNSVMIICNPNAVCYENLYLGNSIINFILDQGIDVCLWNYKGYTNKFKFEFPSFKNIRSDSNFLVKILKEKYQKIGVWGISIGGIPITNIIGNNHDINLLISDKNFSSIESTVKYSFGNFLSKLYKIFLFGDSSTTQDYLKNDSTKKIVLCDHLDEVIPDLASIKSSISKQFISRYFRFNSNTENNNVDSTNNKNLLKFILNDIDYITFINSIGIIVENKKYLSLNKNNANKNKTSDDNLNKLDKEVINANINTLDEEKESILNKNGNNTTLSQKSKLNINLLFTNDNFMELKEYIENFDSACNILTNISSFNSDQEKIEFINSFFENLFTWGSYGDLFNSFDNDNLNDKHVFNSLYKDFSNKQFRKYAVEKLNELARKVSSVIEHVKLFIDNNKENDTKLETLTSFLNGIEKIVTMFYNNQLDSSDDDYLGILIPLGTGHNGILRKKVFDIISDAMIKAKMY